MSKLSLYFLGPPRIERNGQPVETDTRKAIALLAYLALTHQRPFRDHLATLLWPEYDDSHAKAALRRTLSTLKKAVGDGIISSNRDTIWLEPNTIGCDALQFQQFLSPAPPHPCTPAQLETAVSLYHSDFLTGFTLRDSLPFDDWQQQQAEHLRRQLSHALEQLAHHYGQQQQYDRALSHAHRQAALHNNLAPTSTTPPGSTKPPCTTSNKPPPSTPTSASSAPTGSQKFRSSQSGRHPGSLSEKKMDARMTRIGVDLRGSNKKIRINPPKSASSAHLFSLPQQPSTLLIS